MDETRNESRRGQAGESLMRARPTANAAALEDMRAEIAKLGETVTAQAAPATQEALDALEARLLERLDQSSDDSDAQAGRESPPDPVAVQAGRLEAAAERIEAALTSDGERLAAIGETVSREHAMTRAAVTGIADVADVIDKDVIGLRRDLGNRTQTILARLPAPDAEADEVAADGARPRRRVAVLAWTLLAILAGMALEGRTHYAFNLFQWLGN